MELSADHGGEQLTGLNSLDGGGPNIPTSARTVAGEGTGPAADHLMSSGTEDVSADAEGGSTDAAQPPQQQQEEGAEGATPSRKASVAHSTADEDIGLESCPADEETVATFKVLMEHKGFLLAAERDIGMLQVTSRELQDFVDRADEYKDEYFDIHHFASKVGGVWQDRRPVSRAATSAGSLGGTRTITSSVGGSSPTLPSPSRHRIARIFPNNSAILTEGQDRATEHAERLRQEDEANNMSNTSAVVGGLIEQRQPGMARRIAKNEERRRVFDEAMKARAVQQEAEAIASGASPTRSIYGGLGTTNKSSISMTSSVPLGRHSLRVGQGPSTTTYSANPNPTNVDTTTGRCFSRGGIGTTPLNLTTVSLPPLTASMTGYGGKASALPSHLGTSADGSRVLQKKPDALAALNMTRDSLHTNAHGLNRSDFGNLSALPRSSALNNTAASMNGTASSPSAQQRSYAPIAGSAARVRPFASDLVEPALSSFTPEAYYGGISTHPAHTRAPEVERAAKLLQQQARERKLAAEREKALEVFSNEEEAAMAEGFGIPDTTSSQTDANGGRFVGGVLVPSSASAAPSQKRAAAPIVYKRELDRLLAEQEEGLVEQERKHGEEYVPMLEAYYEYHDYAQRKLEAIAGMTGMDGAAERGMGIPPKPVYDEDRDAPQERGEVIYTAL